MDFKIFQISLAIGVLVGASITIWLYRRNSRISRHFKIVIKSNFLLAQDLLDDRYAYFNPYYLKRSEDERIKSILEAGKNVLVTGPPLAGKTRAIFEAIKSLKRKHVVAVVKNTDVDPGSLIFPWQAILMSATPTIIVIDDLQAFVNGKNFAALLRGAFNLKCIIVATCRSGYEFEKAKNMMISNSIYPENIFAAECVVELPRISENDGREVATAIDKSWNDVRFDHTVGSILMPLKEMERRFSECDWDKKTILRGIQRLYNCGIYEGNQIFPLDWIKRVCTLDNLTPDDNRWDKWFGDLAALDFFKRDNDRVRLEEVYLTDIVNPEKENKEIDMLPLLEKIRSIFADIPDALFMLANRAHEIGNVDMRKAFFMNIAIKAYSEALKHWTKDKSPENYGMTQNNLGNAYRTLAEVENKVANCRLAIEAYQNALKVRTKEAFPMDYGMTQNNLGNAHGTLAKVENKVANCRLAIEAYQNALKVRTKEAFPMKYAMTQNNLGNVYRTLAEVENRAANCRLAIEAYQNALKVRTKEVCPMDYGMTQNNLGNAYGTLAKVENKVANCRLAIEAYQNALKVYILEAFPMDYTMTQNNLGNAYRTLAEVENRSANCWLAIEAYRNALQVYTLEAFPMDYAMTQNNLGNAYGTLAKVENKAANCWLAIEAYQNALKIRSKEAFPMDNAGTQNNLGNVYRTLAEVENKAANCKNARQAYEEALKIFMQDTMPVPYEMVKDNLERLSDFCGDQSGQ